MIVCSCNVFTDQDVRGTLSGSAVAPRTACEVYHCLGCSPQCGRCARTIKGIIEDALGACALACQAGCPHSHHHAALDLAPETEYGLAAS